MHDLQAIRRLKNGDMGRLALVAHPDGYNYPGYPLLGLLLMMLFTIGIAVVLGYAVLRSGSVLLAAYLHALIDQVLAFLSAIGFRPHTPVFSFYIGIYGILTLAIVAFFILRNPIWKSSR